MPCLYVEKLEKCINIGQHCSAFSQNDEDAEGDQDYDDRYDPPFLRLAEISDKLGHDRKPTSNHRAFFFENAMPSISIRSSGRQMSATA